MAEIPPHEQAARFVAEWNQAEKDAADPSKRPPTHTGPAVGPNDLLISFIMIGGFLGLLSDGTLGGVIGAGLGAVLAFALRFVFSLPGMLFRLIRRAGQPPPPRRKLASDSIDWEAKRRAKYRKK